MPGNITSAGAVNPASGSTLTGTSLASGIVSSSLTSTGKIATYNTVAQTGNGVISIPGYGRPSAGQTAAVASVATFTPAADSTFLVSANVAVTTATLHNFTVTCAYTNEASASVTLTLAFTQVTGSTLLTAITNVTGVGSYEGITYHIRAKGGTAITIATAAGGTYTTVAYNVEGMISQVA